MNFRVEQLRKSLQDLEVRREAIIAQMIELTYNDAYEEAKEKEEQRIADMRTQLANLAAQKKAAEREAKIQEERKAAAKRIKDLEAALAKAMEEAEADFAKENEDFLKIADDAKKDLEAALDPGTENKE